MTAAEWFEKAKKEGFAIGAFNVDSFDIFKAICEAGQQKRSPVMVEFSPGEADYFGLKNIAALVAEARERYGIPILLNLDHARKVEECLKAIEFGFDEVHFDGSDLPLDENIAGAKRVVEAAHAKGVLVEGEMDKVAGGSEVHLQEIDLEEIKKFYTKPEKAAEFVRQTGVDILAGVFGNVHGTFPNQPLLEFKLLENIAGSVPGTFLSMHGGSGISSEQVKKAISVGGIVKINVNTELRQAFIDSLSEKIGEEPRNYTYYKMTPDIIGAVAAVVEGKIDVFGSAGKI